MLTSKKLEGFLRNHNPVNHRISMIDRMIKCFFRVSACFFFLSNAYSQNDSTDLPEKGNSININSNRSQKNEVGIDISNLQFILGHAGAGYPSLFFRRHFIKTKKIKNSTGLTKTTYQAFRFRVGSNLNFTSTSFPDVRSVVLSNTYYYNYPSNQQLSVNSSFFLRIGKEMQIRSGRFELFYGYDLFYNYTGSINQNLVFQFLQNGNSTYSINYGYKYVETDISIGVAAIGGFKYFLIPRLCFSAEGTFNLGYMSQSKSSTYTSFDTSTQQYTASTVPIKLYSIQSTINPFFLVNIGYYF